MSTPTKEEFLAALDEFADAVHTNTFYEGDYADDVGARQKLIDMWEQVTKEQA